METLVANGMELYHKPRKKMCGIVGIYSLITAVLICLGYNKLYFELKLPNGSVGQLLDVMDYISNSFLMPFISLLTSILIGWVIGPDWIIGEVERNGERFKRAGMYRFMIRYVVPVVMLVLFLVSTGFAAYSRAVSAVIRFSLYRVNRPESIETISFPTGEEIIPSDCGILLWS